VEQKLNVTVVSCPLPAAAAQAAGPVLPAGLRCFPEMPRTRALATAFTSLGCQLSSSGLCFVLLLFA